MDQTIHTTCRDAAERRFPVLSKTKGRRALGRRTRITDAVYLDYDAFCRDVRRGVSGYDAADRPAPSAVTSDDIAPRGKYVDSLLYLHAKRVCGYADSYLRTRRVLIPEWCRIKDDQILREHNGAVIYTCPELAAENDMYSLVESGVNSGGSLTRGCIRCARNRMYNMRTALDMKNYFDDAANCWKARTQTMWEWVYGFRRGVGPAKVK